MHSLPLNDEYTKACCPLLPFNKEGVFLDRIDKWCSGRKVEVSEAAALFDCFCHFVPRLLLYFKETYVMIKEWRLRSGGGDFYEIMFKVAARLACSYTKRSSTE